MELTIRGNRGKTKFPIFVWISCVTPRSVNVLMNISQP